MNWAAYAEAAQHLSDVRGKEARRQAQSTERQTGMRDAVMMLRQRLAAQHTHQATIAQQLRTSLPAVTEASEPRTPVADPDEALRLAWAAVHEADAQTHHAEVRGQRGTLMPDLKPTTRNLLVYGLAAFAVVIVQLAVLTLQPLFNPGNNGLSITSFLVGVCGLPVLAFGAAYVLLATLGQPRMQTGQPADLSVKLGWLICFPGTWGAWVVMLLMDFLIRR